MAEIITRFIVELIEFFEIMAGLDYSKPFAWILLITVAYGAYSMLYALNWVYERLFRR